METDEGDWLRELFVMHAGMVRRFAARRVAAHAVDDVVADVFATAWRQGAAPEQAGAREAGQLELKTVSRGCHDRAVAGPNVVRFPGYREWEKKRIEASNAMMGLLAGAQLAAHLLKLTEGSSHLLPEVFPQVDHIGRFNLTTEEASAILASAATHLGAMSVPYALALHEDYLKTCLGLLQRAGLCTPSTVANTKLAAQHPKIGDLTSGAFDADRLAQLDTLRLMRNCMIHDGGRANSTLVTKVASWSQATEALWIKVAPSLRGISVGDQVTFGHQQLILTLAVTKFLSREANVLVQPAVPRELWADVVVDDLAAQHDGRLPPPPERARKLRGFARFNYAPLRLTDAELHAAVKRR